MLLLWRFIKKGVLKNSAKFRGRQLCQTTLLKKRLWYRYFPVNFDKFFTSFF